MRRSVEKDMGIIIVILIVGVIAMGLYCMKIIQEKDHTINNLQDELVMIKEENADITGLNAQLTEDLDYYKALVEDKSVGYVDQNGTITSENAITDVVRHVVYLYQMGGYDYTTEYYTGELKAKSNN